MDNQTAVQAATETQIEPNGVERAKAKIEEIRLAILNGNETLTAQDLANARGELEFAELRESAAHEWEEKRARAERRDELLSMKNEVSELADVSQFEKLLSKIKKPIVEYLSQIKDRNDRVTVIGEKLAEKDYLPGHIHYSPVEGIEVIPESNFDPLTIGDVSVKTINGRQEVEKVARDYCRNIFRSGVVKII